MKKAQISFEFIVLFTIVFFIFIFLAGFFPGSVDKASSTKGLAENLAKDIKVKAITASLSESDFVTEIIIPNRINSARIQIELRAYPDNMLIIKDGYDREELARVFLPIISSVNDLNPGRPIKELIIRKNAATNNLSIEVVREI